MRKLLSRLLLFSLLKYVSSDIQYTPSCGLKAGTDTFTASGNLTVDDTTNFNPEISIQATTHHIIICTVDLTACSTNVPESGDVCVCTRNESNTNGNNTYHFFARQHARSDTSLEALTAVYKCCRFLSCLITVKVPLGSLPLIYDPALAVYQLFGCNICSGDTKEFTAQSETVSVAEKQFIQVKLCVYQLLTGTITVNGLEFSSACALRNVVLVTVAGTVNQVQMTYTEKGGCQRTGRYTLNLVAVKNLEDHCGK